jgi:hypothetical protein
MVPVLSNLALVVVVAAIVTVSRTAGGGGTARLRMAPGSLGENHR